MNVCTCTGMGPLNVPPAKDSDIFGYTTDTANDYALCQFACERDYCPSPCKSVSKRSEGPNFCFGHMCYGPMTPVGSGLLSIQEAFTTISMGDRFSDIIVDTFRSQNTCPRPKAKRGEIERRDWTMDCIISTFLALAKNPLYVNTLYRLLLANDLPGPANKMTDLPQYSEE